MRLGLCIQIYSHLMNCSGVHLQTRLQIRTSCAAGWGTLGRGVDSRKIIFTQFHRRGGPLRVFLHAPAFDTERTCALDGEIYLCPFLVKIGRETKTMRKTGNLVINRIFGLLCVPSLIGHLHLHHLASSHCPSPHLSFGGTFGLFFLTV